MNDNIQLRDAANTELTYARAIINTVLDSGAIDNENTLNTLSVALLSVIRAHEALIKGVLPPPNQSDELPENKLHGAIGDINNVELSLHQLKSDLYENKPDTPTLYAQLSLMANTLSKSLNQLDELIKEN